MRDHSASGIRMHHHGSKSRASPTPGLLPKRNRGKGLTFAIDPDLMEGNNPATPHMRRGRPDEGGGIPLMDEHVAPDGEIEGRLIDEVFCGAFTKFNVRVACGLCPLARDGENFGAAVDADDCAVRADQLGGQHRNVAATAAEVEYAQTRCEAGLTQEALRDRLQDGRLKH